MTTIERTPSSLKVVVATGGFDPIHSGHIAYLEAAAKLGDILIVGINSDAWLTRKKGYPFMPVGERVAIVKALKCVDHTVLFDDSDGSAIEAINNTRLIYPDCQIIFSNGGDRTIHNIPEQTAFKDDDTVEFAFGVGGDFKMNSSSWILQEWKAPKNERQWGYYRVLHEVPGMKVKELTVEPGKKLSMQKHQYRAEFWIVSEGIASLKRFGDEGVTVLQPHHQSTIYPGQWHQLINQTTEPVRIVEIQYGEKCDEEDIIRK
jgi:cytidyltransferase-like protein